MLVRPEKKVFLMAQYPTIFHHTFTTHRVPCLTQKERRPADDVDHSGFMGSLSLATDWKNYRDDLDVDWKNYRDVSSNRTGQRFSTNRQRRHHIIVGKNAGAWMFVPMLL